MKQTQIPIAFHLRDLVGKELEKQVDEDIMEPVDPSCVPTTGSNLVIVPKDKPMMKFKARELCIYKSL